MAPTPANSNLSDVTRFEAAICRFDAENARDPNVEIVDAIPQPRELLYAQRLSAWVTKLSPQASEPLLLASRCQHICRWTIPRQSYDLTRAGYLKWRADLKVFHAQKAGDLLRETGYDDATVSLVQALNLKKNFPHDPESRVLEDALCLVFLQYQLADLAAKTSDDKMINALQKSWRKMTPQAHAHALKLHFSPHEKSLVERALAPQ